MLTPEEEAEALRAAHLRVGGVRLLRVLVDGPGELGADEDEGEHGDDLGGETGDHEVDADLRHAVGVGGRGDGAAGGLEDQGEEIAADEEAGDELRGEPREAGPVDGDDAREAEVDGGGEEGGADGQADEVDDEGVVVEVVLPEHDAAGVADDFEARAADDGHEVAPCAVFDGEADACEQAEPENGEV